MPFKDHATYLEYHRNWRATHKKEIRSSQKTYRDTHSDEIRKKHAIYIKTYAKAHPEKKRVSQRTYQAHHRELRRAAQKRRRALKAHAAISDFTAAQWRMLQEHFQHRCAYCGKRAKGHLTQDHITPLSQGGNHTLANIIPACLKCNLKKQTGPVLRPVQPLLL
jgi:5-methylcytosine-specific restriction endonuclease McrA